MLVGEREWLPGLSSRGTLAHRITKRAIYGNVHAARL